MSVTRILPPPNQVSADHWTFKKWFQDIYQYSEGGILIPTSERTPIFGGNRNLLINGDASVWQRGTSFTVGAVTKVYGADRWCQGRGSVAGSTLAQYTITTSDAPLPLDFKYALNMTRTAGDTNSQDVSLANHIESNTAVRLRGKTCVLSFWAKVGSGVAYGATGGFRVIVFGGTGTDENIFAGYTGRTTAVSWQSTTAVTTTWKYFQVPFTFDSAINEACVLFSYHVPGNATAVANENILITGVQIEVAADSNYPKATAFDFVPFEVALERCQRYYQKSFQYGTTPAQNTASTLGLLEFPCTIAGATTQISSSIPFAPRMRTTPTVTFYNSNAANAFVLNLTRVTSATATTTSGLGERGFAVSCTGVAGWVVGDILAVHWQADADI